MHIKYGGGVADLIEYFLKNQEEFKSGIIVDRIFGIQRMRQKLLDWQRKKKDNRD